MPAQSPVIADRYTTEIDAPFVVFLIGMRVNRPLAFRKWVIAAASFPKMVEVLSQHPEKGFLSGEQFFRFFPLTTIMVSYWRSFDDLERFARSKDDPHAEAWRRFNQQVGNDGSVGIWHETYSIDPGKYEMVYGNMPLFGLAKATGKVIPTRGNYHHNARGRLNGREETVPAEMEVEY